MIPVGTQYQNVRQLRDDLEELVATELGKFPNGLPAIWVEDRQARTVSGGVSVIIQEDFAPTATRARMGNQSDTAGEWVVVLRSFGTPEQFRAAKEKMRSLPQSMRETALPFREGVVPQVTFRIQSTITRNTWQNSPLPSSIVTPPPPPPDPEEPDPRPTPITNIPARLIDPSPASKGSLGIGLNSVTDYSGNLVFLNIAKQAREYVTSAPGTFDTNEASKIDRDSNGWAKSLTPTSAAQFTELKLILSANRSNLPTGRYVVKWAGNATFNWFQANVVESSPNRQVIEVGNVDICWITFTSIDSANHFRDLVVVKESQEALLDSGEIFNPDYLVILQKFQTLRFMDWQQTNGSPLVNWADRATPEHFSYALTKGVPYEIQAALCNKLNADGWFNIPHRATDAFVNQAAATLLTSLNAPLKAYIEYTNEQWNPIFSQGDWIEGQAIARYSASIESSFTKRCNWFGWRTDGVGAIFKSVWGVQANRLVIALGAQAANTYIASESYTTPLEGLPRTNIDAIAIAPYFNAGGEVGSANEPNLTTVKGWSTDDLFTQINTGGLLSGAYPQGLLAEAKNWTVQHKTYCNSIGKRLIAYEGGQHFVDYSVNGSLRYFFIVANRSPKMYQAYLDYLADWKDAGGELFCHFQDAGNWSNSGYWGALESMGQYEEGSAKYNALYNFMIQTPKWW